MEWDEIGRAMAVVAHPDDTEYGCAGTVAKLTRDGKEVFYVMVTDGSKGSADPEMSAERLIGIRRTEECAAARVLGVSDASFLNFPDGMLEPTIEVRKAITACIRRFKPDVVLCQSPVRDLAMGVFVQHPDHLAAGEATLAAIYPCARDRMTFPELLSEGLEPHKVVEAWIMGTPSPDFFVDIEATIDLKVKALQEHVSQVDHDRVAEFIPERARQLASEHGMKYAEGFRRIQIGR